MSHIIQPILIDSILLCPTEQGNKRTVGVMLGDAAFVAANKWDLVNVEQGESGDGTVKIGTSCPQSLSFTLTGDSTEGTENVTVTIELNGVEIYDSVNATDFTYSDTVALTPSPCGNVLAFRATINTAACSSLPASYILHQNNFQGTVINDTFQWDMPLNNYEKKCFDAFLRIHMWTGQLPDRVVITALDGSNQPIAGWGYDNGNVAYPGQSGNPSPFYPGSYNASSPWYTYDITTKIPSNASKIRIDATSGGNNSGLFVETWISYAFKSPPTTHKTTLEITAIN